MYGRQTKDIRIVVPSFSILIIPESPENLTVKNVKSVEGEEGLITYDLWPMVWSPMTYGLITYDLWFDHLWPRSSAAAVAESWWWPSLPADNEYGNGQILMLPKGWEMEAGPLSINVRSVPQPKNTWH